MLFRDKMKRKRINSVPVEARENEKALTDILMNSEYSGLSHGHGRYSRLKKPEYPCIWSVIDFFEPWILLFLP